MQINQLPPASSLDNNDKFAVDTTDGVTKSITASALVALTRTNSYGSPLVADTVTAMTDHSKVYVYTGNETGYTNGDWYYYNGTAWVSGGAYNSVAVNTDTTLTLSGVAADARAVGDRISAVDTALSTTIAGVQEDVQDVFQDLATEYSDLSWPVSAGQYCLYYGEIYKARQDIPTIESWNFSHWELTNLGEGLSDLGDVPGDIATLNAAIVTERLARQTADNTLTGSINTEVAAREAAVSAEASAREAADTALSSAISAEATARGAADNALKGTIEDVTGVTFMEFEPGVRNCSEVGATIGDVTLTTGAYVHGLAPCTSDDVVTVNVRGAGNARAWAYLNENYVVLQCSEANLWQKDVELPHPPEGTAYVLINNRTGDGYMPTGYYATVGKTIAPARAAILSRDNTANIQSALENFNYYPLNVGLFELGTVYVTGNNTVGYAAGNGDAFRVKAGDTFTLPAGAEIYPALGYEVRTIKVVDAMASSVSNFTADKITLSEAGEYTFAIRTADQSQVTLNDATVRNLYIKLYSQNHPKYSYQYSGEKISLRTYGYNISESTVPFGGADIPGTQGCAIYGNTLFILKVYQGSSSILLFDMTTHASIATLSTTGFGHGNSCQFSSERADPADEFPLLYISGFNGANSASVFVYRITHSGSTYAAILYKTIALSGEPGYNVDIAVDSVANRLLTLGTYTSDALDRTGNHMILSVYDLSEQTETDGKFYPQFISKITMPFIYCAQDCKYINGHLMVISSADPAVVTATPPRPYYHSSWIYWIDPSSGEINTVFKYFPTTLSNKECEMADVYVNNGVPYLFIAMYKASTSYLLELDR